jgi:hypothetical protein
MYYTTAKRLFKANRDSVDPQSEPLAWNLNEALYQLAVAQEAELKQIRDTLTQILVALQR